MTKPTFFAYYFVAIFLQSGTYGLTFLLPPLFEAFGANEADVGRVLGITAITTILTVLFLDRITLRLGRMRVITLSSVLIAFALFLFGTANEPRGVVYVAGALLGTGWGAFYVLTPVVLTQLVPPKERIRSFTLLSVFIMAGFGLAPVFGDALTKAGFGVEITFIITGVLCLISGTIFFALKPSVARLSITPETSDNARLSLAALRQVARSRAIRPILMVWLGASVFAAVSNFQTVYADLRGLEYSNYFLAYTITVIICRIAFAKFIGGNSPYAVIAVLLAVMSLSIILLLVLDSSGPLYILAAILFGIGYGVSYPIVKAMAANDAKPELLSQTLQIFGVAYFLGVFGFPLLAGWLVTQYGIAPLLGVAIAMALMETSLAGSRFLRDR